MGTFRRQQPPCVTADYQGDGADQVITEVTNVAKYTIPMETPLKVDIYANHILAANIDFGALFLTHLMTLSMHT